MAKKTIESHRGIASTNQHLDIKKSPFAGASGWSVADSNCRPLPCEGSALNQLS